MIASVLLTKPPRALGTADTRILAEFEFWLSNDTNGTDQIVFAPGGTNAQTLANLKQAIVDQIVVNTGQAITLAQVKFWNDLT